MKAGHIGHECQRNSNFPARSAQYHARLVEMLTASSNPETADWFTNYLKGEITYRGLKTGMLRGILAEFHEATLSISRLRAVLVTALVVPLSQLVLVHKIQELSPYR